MISSHVPLILLILETRVHRIGARLPFLIVHLGLFRPVLDEKVGNPKQRRGNSGGTILLMVQKSGVHPLRLVVYPIIYKVFYKGMLEEEWVLDNLFAVEHRIEIRKFSLWLPKKRMGAGDYELSSFGFWYVFLHLDIIIWMVVSNIVFFHPYLGKISILTNIFQRGWNHQLEFFHGIMFDWIGFSPKSHTKNTSFTHSRNPGELKWSCRKCLYLMLPICNTNISKVDKRRHASKDGTWNDIL